MKYCLFFLLLIPFTSNAQLRPIAHKNEPVYFLDSVKYTRLPIFDAEALESVTVIKDKKTEFPNGALFMTSKPGTKHNFISLEAFAQQQIGDTKSYMIMIDNDFITNMAGFVIDSTYVLSCETKSTRDFVHLQHMPEMKILKITTATKENKEKANKIIIRG